MIERDGMDPFPPDQQFGAAAAEDQAAVEAMGDDEAARRGDEPVRAPRAGNKAEPTAS